MHEWAHLRWGVFDEYPVGNETKFYFGKNNDGLIKAVKCGKNLGGTRAAGYVLDGGTLRPGGVCHINQTTFLPEDKCFFSPDKNDPGVTSSLMYSPSITDVSSLE